MESHNGCFLTMCDTFKKESAIPVDASWAGLLELSTHYPLTIFFMLSEHKTQYVDHIILSQNSFHQHLQTKAICFAIEYKG